MRVFLRRMDLRQHRKMVMIDNYIAYTGSMNMVDPRYFKQDSGVGQWIDLDGANGRPGGDLDGHRLLLRLGNRDRQAHSAAAPRTSISCRSEEASGHTIHTIASGPGFPEDLIHQALLTAAYAAKEHLIIDHPLLRTQRDDLLHAICTAAQRGVDVSIILPRKNDSLLVGWASQRPSSPSCWRPGSKSISLRGGLLHTKSVLVDGELSLVGTVNLGYAQPVAQLRDYPGHR
ncbi:phospholipase D-like domain-containing protein [Klebsiella pneumoniae subsp. pneumoniae]|nr:phospholipase D-like domain-containing protein [Klebsiella pneumoniae subsp. pneumoniae]